MVSIALDRSIELSSTDLGGTAVHVVAFVDADGDLIALGHDVGSAAHRFDEHRGFDHWVVVEGELKDLVLLELLRERFEGAEAPTAEFMQWLQDRDLAHEVGSAAGEHRGPARIGPPHGRRRSGTRGTRPTRAGP